MTESRLSAHQAYALISKGNPIRAAEAICSRANDGIIVAKAQTLIWGKERRIEAEIPANFWWARGKGALKQNWDAGDFETWIEQRIHCRAYGVTFLESEIRAMIPRSEADNVAVTTTKDAELAEEFMPSAEALAQVEAALRLSRDRAADLIIRYCAGDMLKSRCQEMKVTTENRYGATEEASGPTDLDHLLWEKLSFVFGGVADWSNGRFFGRINDDGDVLKVRMWKVQFSRFDIKQLITAEELRRTSPDGHSPAAAQKADVPKGGRPPAPFWDDLWTEMCRALYVGDLKPARQADIERAMLDFVESQGIGAGVSTIRPRARKLWQAISDEDEN